ncbi:biotin synthase BioB [Desulfosporosinus sp. BICA1-9]|uniref:biotin synthase BioB n=1 Tax=Desulfosporosinus sp. BICA1-9 TaxID=1531958 RepID=UPI00054C2BD5|nr:biotin synthase BioB [Desulfosporosinus sp. BICA1-9]KJS48292.1 MAG: biotin synthase [Peptococcaceae bacterium BRH_c23]KJS90106.1 MAG: biotin synthase [Desulfosporosinus sp. BICA1-9]
MSYIKRLKNNIINGYRITKEEALLLYDWPLEELLASANEIRQVLCKDSFDLCTIINGKCGNCSEDCKYCAQSAHNKACVDDYSLLCGEEILNSALANYHKGVLRFSVVTSGRSLDNNGIMDICGTYQSIKEKCNISLCASHGLLTYEQFILLKKAGVTRYHCNLETSRKFFPNICTTHTYDDKITAIKNAQQVGLEICSGGILGLGEEFEDRVDMVLDLRELGIRSIPVNILNPVKGTPLEHNPKLSDEEVLRTIAVFRFIIPDGAIRLAGGRELLADKGKRAFLSGANAAISGDMLTTSGISIKEDKEIISDCGYKVQML